MKKFIVACMLVVGFVGFSGTSEAGPLRNFVQRVQNRQFRPVQKITCATTNVVNNVRPGWVVSKPSGCSTGGCSSSGVVSTPSNTVWSTPSSGQVFQTPLRNAVYNLASPSTCTNCHR